MILYDHQKRFAGVSSELLEMLHFKNMDELLRKTNDIANFFVSKPGYIFNFKNFSWIDYCLHSGIKEPKVIIQGQKEKQLIADIQITPFFILGQEGGFSEGYLIKLINHKTRIASESEKSIEPLNYEPSFTSSITFNISEPLNEVKIESSPEVPVNSQKVEVAQPTSMFELNKTINIENTQIVAKPIVSEAAFSSKSPQEAVVSTKFDPAIAANELGLPQEMVIEFVQDFIKEANDYKSWLELARKKQDFNQLKTISHKIKGAATNLRIKNIAKTMDVIHDSNDLDAIEKAITTFYEQVNALQEQLPTNEPTKISDPLFKVQPQHTQEDIYPFELPEQKTDFDLSKTASKLGLPITLVKEFVDDFVAQTEELKEQIKSAASSGDILTLKSLFGKLKGVSIHLKMQKISSVIQDIQNSAEIEEISNKKDEFFALLENLKKSIKENA